MPGRLKGGGARDGDSTPATRPRRSTRSTRSTRSSGSTPSRGFTMVELVVVISLIGILAAVSTSRLFSSDDLKARAFANALAQVLSAGQRMAVAQRRTVYAQVVTSPGSLQLCLDAACTVPVAPAPGDAIELTAPAGMGLQTTSTAFNFDGLGRPSIAAALTLTVLGVDGSSTAMGITLQPETGHVATF